MSAVHPHAGLAPGEHPTGEEIIRLEHVGRRYVVGDNEVVALDDVSFTVPAQGPDPPARRITGTPAGSSRDG